MGAEDVSFPGQDGWGGGDRTKLGKRLQEAGRKPALGLAPLSSSAQAISFLPIGMSVK